MRYDVHKLRHLRRVIGRNIHVLRLQRGLPLHKLARITALDDRRIDLYEIGKDEINLNDLFKIACALNKPVSELVDHKGFISYGWVSDAINADG